MGCGFTKSVSEFHRNSSTKDGLQGWCKECLKEKRRGEKSNRPHGPDCRCQGCVAQINSVAGQKYCRGCDTIKSISEFSNRAPYCKPCSADKKREFHSGLDADGRARVNLARRLARYSLTHSELSEMLARQAGLCAAACGQRITMADAQVDHDHACCSGKESCGKCVRSLLCANCNSALGFIKDDPDRAYGLANYLMRFQDVLRQT